MSYYDYPDGDATLRFSAGLNEINDLTVTVDPDGQLVFVDNGQMGIGSVTTGLPIEITDGDGPGGCDVNGNSAKCPPPQTVERGGDSGIEHGGDLGIDLGNNPDRVELPATPNWQGRIYEHDGTITVTRQAWVFGGGGDDTIMGSGGADDLRGGDGSDVLHGYGGNDLLEGNSGGLEAPPSDHEELHAGSGDDLLIPSPYDDVLDGGADTDKVWYLWSSEQGVTVDLSLIQQQDTRGAGHDRLTSVENILGSEYDDTLKGDENSNVLTGWLGADNLIGGAGTDTVDYTWQSGPLSVTLHDGLANDGYDGGGESEGDNVHSSVENVIGGRGNDTIEGSFANNELRGGPGDDTIEGRGGNDLIDGGDGVDTASHAAAGTAVNVSLMLQGAGQHTGGAGIDTLTSIENLVGSDYDDTLEGASFQDNILYGGAGTDTLSYANSQTGVSGTLNNTVYAKSGDSSKDTTLGFENFTGSSLDDTLLGDSKTNWISGGSGADTIYGGGGQVMDIIEGGPGSEVSMNGGDGFDVVYDVGGGNDTYYNSGGQALFVDLGPASDADTYTGAGSETVYYSPRGQGVNVSLNGLADDGQDCPGRYCEHDNVGTTIENVVGGSGNDTFSGSPQKANNFTGAAGADTVDYSQSPQGVTVRPDGKPNDGMQGEGDNVASDIENITGSPKADTLIGSAVGNVLKGLQGTDHLYGLSGSDIYEAGQDADPDVLSERYGFYTGTGDDVFKMRDGTQAKDKVITCGGPGDFDSVDADATDLFNDYESCEQVEVTGS